MTAAPRWHSLLDTQFPRTRAELGGLQLVEEQLLYSRSVRFVAINNGREKALSMTLLYAICHMASSGLGWRLLDHLSITPLFPDQNDPVLVELLQGEKSWWWKSLGRGEAVYLDVGRMRRFLQLLGMLDHSRVEEWERSVAGG